MPSSNQLTSKHPPGYRSFCSIYSKKLLSPLFGIRNFQVLRQNKISQYSPYILSYCYLMRLVLQCLLCFFYLAFLFEQIFVNFGFFVSWNELCVPKIFVLYFQQSVETVHTVTANPLHRCTWKLYLLSSKFLSRYFKRIKKLLK